EVGVDGGDAGGGCRDQGDGGEAAIRCGVLDPRRANCGLASGRVDYWASPAPPDTRPFDGHAAAVTSSPSETMKLPVSEDSSAMPSTSRSTWGGVRPDRR